MIDLEASLVRAFGWSLRDIDETDVESLLDFVFRMTGEGKGAPAGAHAMRPNVFCDEVSWL